MSPFKIELFQQDYPNQPFPPFRQLSEDERKQVRECLRLHSALGCDDPEEELVVTICQEAISQKNVPNAEDERFSLLQVMHQADIAPQPAVFLDWWRDDDMDEMKVSDVDRWLADLWFPGPDDLFVYDSSFNWVLWIDHDGRTAIWRKS